MVYGSEDQFLMRYQPSKRCGLINMNMTNQDQQLFTGSDSNFDKIKNSHNNVK